MDDDGKKKWALLIAGALAISLFEQDDVGNIQKSVQEWIPFEDEEESDEGDVSEESDDDEYDDEDDDDASEQDYRMDLADHLRAWDDEEQHYYIIEESGLRRSRNDIWVRGIDSGKTVLIELKLDLKSSNELNRLLGQLTRSSDGADAIIVVLIDPDENILTELSIGMRQLAFTDKVIVETWFTDD